MKIGLIILFKGCTWFHKVWNQKILVKRFCEAKFYLCQRNRNGQFEAEGSKVYFQWDVGGDIFSYGDFFPFFWLKFPFFVFFVS